MHPLNVMLVGDAERCEFAETRHALDAAARLWLAPDPKAAETLLAHQQLAPEVIVLAEAYPGQFSPAAIGRLRDRAPLARVVTLLGSWCEGETRTGRPCPGAARLYWHQGPPRSWREVAWIAQGRTSSWALPATATEEERLLAMSEAPLPTGHGLVAIYAPHAAMAEWLSAACRLGGYSTVRLAGPRWAQVTGVAAGIFDATDLGSGEADQLARMARQLDRPPLVVLLDFPRVADRDRALACGGTAVLSKPLVLGDLLWCLRGTGTRGRQAGVTRPRPTTG